MYLDQEKTDSSKRRQIRLKSERTVDAQCRKLWSKKHGHDTYGSDDSDRTQMKRTKEAYNWRDVHVWVHHSPTYHECPLNVKNQRSGVSVDDRVSDNNDVISYSEDTLSEAFLWKKVYLPQLVTLVGVLKMT